MNGWWGVSGIGDEARTLGCWRSDSFRRWDWVGVLEGPLLLVISGTKLYHEVSSYMVVVEACGSSNFWLELLEATSLERAFQPPTH